MKKEEGKKKKENKVKNINKQAETDGFILVSCLFIFFFLFLCGRYWCLFTSLFVYECPIWEI